jgi:uncharacterized protein (TIGR02284 family)
MNTPNREVVSTLKTLFATCKDGENGYRMSAHHVQPEGLKTLLQGCAQQRAEYAAELRTALEGLGSQAVMAGTIAGALQQGWTNIQSAVTGGDEKALLAECVRGEELARKDYEDALQQDLSADVRALVQRQLAGILAVRDRLGTPTEAAI